MSRTNWKDLPNITTPITAANLKADYDDLYDNIFYKTGDTFSANSDRFALPGLTTGSGKYIVFTITTPKSMKNINSITINNLTVTVRHNGSYIPSANLNFLTHSNFSSATAEKVSDNTIAIIIVGINAWTNTQNNVAVTVTPYSNFKVTFN